MKKQRRRSTIKKARESILKEADRLQAAGIDVSRRFIFVGGQRPKNVQSEWDKRKEKEKHE